MKITRLGLVFVKRLRSFALEVNRVGNPAAATAFNRWSLVHLHKGKSPEFIAGLIG
jgi:hypothetical protein